MSKILPKTPPQCYVCVRSDDDVWIKIPGSDGLLEYATGFANGFQASNPTAPLRVYEHGSPPQWLYEFDTWHPGFKAVLSPGLFEQDTAGMLHEIAMKNLRDILKAINVPSEDITKLLGSPE